MPKDKLTLEEFDRRVMAAMELPEVTAKKNLLEKLKTQSTGRLGDRVRRKR
tara:strand:- start:181 stop:333 length:153 start_codon:yes stop_codon:yes gene_type:complete